MGVGIPVGFWWWGLITFGVMLLVHVWAWRKRRVVKHFPALCVVFLGGGALLFSGLAVFLGWGVLPAALLHIAASTSYIAIYPAFQASSPTLVLLEFLREHPQGVSEGEILTRFGQGIVEDRIEDLELAGLISRNAETWSLSASAKRLTSFFRTYRNFIGLPEGAG